MHKRPNKRVNRRKREKRFLMKLAPGASIPFFTPRRFVFAVFISLFPLLYPIPYCYSMTLLAAKTSAIKISVFPDIRENECMKKKTKNWQGTTPSISIILSNRCTTPRSKNIEINWFGSPPKCGFITSGGRHRAKRHKPDAWTPLV